MKRTLVGIPVALIVAAAACLYTVDQAEYATVVRLGRPVVTLDGDSDAGLHVGWPWPVERVVRFDRRVQAFDLPPAELLTHDAAGRTIDKTLTVEAYVAWRIAGPAGAERFLRTVGTPEQARLILAPRVGGRLAAVVGAMPLEELVGVASPAEVTRRGERLREQFLGPDAAGDDLRTLARERYGIEVLDVRLRRFNYPPAVRPAIHERIISERAKKAADYQSQGAQRAAEIASVAERDARTLLADARAAEARLRKAAEIDADRVRNEAHALDPEFYAFVQKLETLARVLGDSRDVLLLSGKHELFDALLKPPKERPPPGPRTP